MMADFQEDLPQIPPSYGQLSGENDEMMINPTILLSEKKTLGPHIAVLEKTAGWP